MAKRVIVDRIDGITHLYSDNGGNSFKAHGTAIMESTIHNKVVGIIGEMPGNILTEQDVIEYTEIENGNEKPVQIIKMTEYLEEK